MKTSMASVVLSRSAQYAPTFALPSSISFRALILP